MRRARRGLGHAGDIENLAAAQAGIDQQGVETAGAQEAPVHLGGAEGQAALDIFLRGTRRFEVEQRRAEAADREAERLLEFGRALRRWPIALGEQSLERGEVEFLRR